MMTRRGARVALLAACLGTSAIHAARAQGAAADSAYARAFAAWSRVHDLSGAFGRLSPTCGPGCVLAEAAAPVAALQAALTQFPGDARAVEANDDLAASYMELAMYDSAAAAYARAIPHGDGADTSSARFMLAAMREATGQSRRAAEDYEAIARALAPIDRTRSAIANLGAARALLAAGDSAAARRAIAHVTAAGVLNRDMAPHRISLGSGGTAAPVDSLMALYRTMIGRAARWPIAARDLRLELAGALTQRGLLDSAVVELRAAVARGERELPPSERIEPEMQLAQSLAGLGWMDGAITALVHARGVAESAGATLDAFDAGYVAAKFAWNLGARDSTFAFLEHGRKTAAGARDTASARGFTGEEENYCFYPDAPRWCGPVLARAGARIAAETSAGDVTQDLATLAALARYQEATGDKVALNRTVASSRAYLQRAMRGKKETMGARSDSATMLEAAALAAEATGDAAGAIRAQAKRLALLRADTYLSASDSTNADMLALGLSGFNAAEATDAYLRLGSLYARTRDARHAAASYDSAAIALRLLARTAGAGSWDRPHSASELDVSSVDAASPYARRLESRVAFLAGTHSALASARDRALASLAAAEQQRGLALAALRSQVYGEQASALAKTADLPHVGRAMLDRLRGDSAVLYYLAGADTLRVWLASGDSIVAAAVPLRRDSLTSQVNRARRCTHTVAGQARGTDRDATRWITRGVEDDEESDSTCTSAFPALAAALLPPSVRGALPSSGTLVVVPDGPLALVPFTALPLDSAGTPLAARLAVRVTPSLGVATAPPGGDAGGPLVVGDPAIPRALSDLPDLPQARDEARSVAKMLGSRALTDSLATEPAVRSRLTSAAVVHLAAHGRAYNSLSQAPASHVVLTATGGYDGLLTVGEIVDGAPLHADLVVLSACQTALGSVSASEGTIGLQRALIGKGAKSVLASLWSVSDEATARLMTSFYTHWLRDGDRPVASVALQRAENELRTWRPNGGSAAPFSELRYWAAFTLAGADVRAPESLRAPPAGYRADATAGSPSSTSAADRSSAPPHT